MFQKILKAWVFLCVHIMWVKLCTGYMDAPSCPDSSDLYSDCSLITIKIINMEGRSIWTDIYENTSVEGLKSSIEAKMGIPFGEQLLFFDGKRLGNGATLKSAYIKSGDFIVVQKVQVTDSSDSLYYSERVQGIEGVNEDLKSQEEKPDIFTRVAEKVMQIYEKFPEEIEGLQYRNDQLYYALKDSNIMWVVDYVRKFEKIIEKGTISRLEALELKDSRNERLVEAIQEVAREDIEKDLESVFKAKAGDYAPVTMLFIDAKINGHSIQAFVDSGAQSTIIGRATAEKLGLLRLLDRRFEGTARGVGSGRILGQVHSVELQFKDRVFNWPVLVMEERKFDFLLGLDLLRHLQCSIDLYKNELTFKGGEFSLPFLSKDQLKH